MSFAPRQVWENAGIVNGPENPDSRGLVPFPPSRSHVTVGQRPSTSGLHLPLPSVHQGNTGLGRLRGPILRSVDGPLVPGEVGEDRAGFRHLKLEPGFLSAEDEVTD